MRIWLLFERGMISKPTIAVIEASRTRATKIREGLGLGGWDNVTVLADTKDLATGLARIDPDIVLIDLANPSRDLLEDLSKISGAVSRPVALFVDRTDAELTRTALQAGVSAYVVDGLSPDRIVPVLETAMERFEVTSRLRAERDAAKQELQDRKTIDRAKTLLMRAKGIAEEEAYGRLRKASMDQGRKVVEIAQALVTATELLE